MKASRKEEGIVQLHLRGTFAMSGSSKFPQTLKVQGVILP